MPSFPGKPDFSSAGAEDGLAVVLPLALLPALPTLTGYFIHTFFFFFNFYFANLQPGLQNFPRRDCASAAGAVAMRGARNARVPPPRGRDRRSGAGKRGGAPGPGPAVPGRRWGDQARALLPGTCASEQRSPRAELPKVVPSYRCPPISYSSGYWKPVCPPLCV